MSWRSYQVLTPQPDFSVDPVLGVMDTGRILTELGQAPAFAEWRGDTPLAFGFSWRLQSPAEFRTFAEFMNAIGGKSTPFFLPSWAPDFELTAPAAIGDIQIRVKAAGFINITENRPDTDGRQIFLVSTDARFQPCSVVGVEVDGDDEVLTLDLPIAYDFDPVETMVGRLYLVRLADDRIEYEFVRPGNCLVPLRAITSRQTRRVNMQELVGSEQTFSLKAFSDVIAEDLDPLLFTFTTPTALGPEVYGTSQADNFFRDWSAIGEVGGVMLQSSAPGATAIPSVLYDSSFLTSHLALAFDAGGNESIAWHTNPGEIRIGWKSSGTNHWLDFIGISPVMFQTWAIDGSISAGDGDLVVFYIREGYSGIFARFYRESFATEHLVVRSPTAPIYLQLARREEGRIEVVGMDAGHRLCRWRTGGYLTPPERQILNSRIAGVSGEFRELRVFASSEDLLATQISNVSGTFREIRIAAAIAEFGTSRIVPVASGAYTEVRIPIDLPDESATARLAATATGEYKLIAKMGAVEETGNSRIRTTITGSYS